MSLIGKTVKFRNSENEIESGKVVDKLLVNYSGYHDGTAITSYLIEPSAGAILEVVGYSNIISIIPTREISKVGPEDRINLNIKLPGIIPKQSSIKTSKNPE